MHAKKENQAFKILHVDDDTNVLELIEARLKSAGFDVDSAQSGRDAVIKLKKSRFDLMISDMKMPDMSGMEVLTEARCIQPELPIIFLTAYGTIPDAVKAAKAVAACLIKPIDCRELVFVVRKVLEERPSLTDVGDIGSVLRDMDTAQSLKMKELYSLVQRVANSDVNALISGESGVGKERIARLIHQLSPRSKQPFVVVDCGSAPASLLESELFGHVKGSFTHAASDKKGLIETAHKGTLFLDEIGNISVEMQVRLVRFLEDRKILRIGDLKENTVDCRVVAATSSDIVEDIKAGNFREDLYYRLRVVAINVPRLRDRKEDIPILAEIFTQTYARRHGTRSIKLPDETINYLCDYPWPGNVRELKNAIEAGIVLCRDKVLKPRDLHLTGFPSASSTDEFVEESNSFSLEDTERNAIIGALKQAGGVQKEAAKILGITRRAIHYKIKKYDIDSSVIRGQSR